MNLSTYFAFLNFKVYEPISPSSHKLNFVAFLSSNQRNGKTPYNFYYKAELLQEGIFFLIHLFARAVLVMKKLEIEKNKPTFFVSVLKVEYYVVLVSSISNFFITKMALQIFG